LRGKGAAGAIASNLCSWLAFVLGAALGSLSLSSHGLVASLAVCAGAILALLLSQGMTLPLRRDGDGHTKV
jgi:hypothetical protein